MARYDPSFSWRLEAVSREPGDGLSEAALQSFKDAGEFLRRPGAFEGCAVVVESQTFGDLTGFHPRGGEVIDAGVVRRAADAATPSRAKALAACAGGSSADYVSLSLFLGVCARHGLALRADRPISRGRGA